MRHNLFFWCRCCFRPRLHIPKYPQWTFSTSGFSGKTRKRNKIKGVFTITSYSSSRNNNVVLPFKKTIKSLGFHLELSNSPSIWTWVIDSKWRFIQQTEEEGTYVFLCTNFPLYSPSLRPINFQNNVIAWSFFKVSCKSIENRNLSRNEDAYVLF